jgi:hypothetical protein
LTAEGENMTMAFLVLQTARDFADPLANKATRWLDSVIGLLDSPLPYSPLTEYALLILLLWFFARRRAPEPNLGEQAQEVLDHKYQQGELTKDAYDKYRQDMTLRNK